MVAALLMLNNVPFLLSRKNANQSTYLTTLKSLINSPKLWEPLK